MGRPLKIQKYGTAQGITYNADGTANTPAAGVPVDQAYPQFSQLTDATYPVTMTENNFFGVVGGASSAACSTTYPRVKVRVFITGFAEEDGYIIRQKGSHKYLVGGTTARTALVSGYAYRITTVGNTDWNSYGLVGTAAVGAIFTATAALGNTGTGRVNAVGVCVLTSDLSPTAGLMSISFFQNGADSVETPLSKLTNKFLQGWTGFVNADGTSLTEYADAGNNLGPVNYSGETTYVANYFTDEASTLKSGADAATFANTTGEVELAQVENYTS